MRKVCLWLWRNFSIFLKKLVWLLLVKLILLIEVKYFLRVVLVCYFLKECIMMCLEIYNNIVNLCGVFF